jgi:hypothetical protein
MGGMAYLLAGALGRPFEGQAEGVPDALDHAITVGFVDLELCPPLAEAVAAGSDRLEAHLGHMPAPCLDSGLTRVVDVMSDMSISTPIPTISLEKVLLAVAPERDPWRMQWTTVRRFLG